MTYEERYMANLIFKAKILEKDAYEFQNFFTKIMSKYDPDFTPIKPQGRIGDRKNDGYNPKTGVYYQVYAPERIDSKDAIEKIEKDIEGLYEYWNSKCPIKEYCFVMNDKYKGVYPEIESKILEIENEYNIDAKLILAKDIENMFMELDFEKMIEIIGMITINDISKISFADLNSIIEYIINMPYNKEIENNILPAEMENKICFNNLNPQIANILNVHSIYIGQLEKYFSNKGNFEREKIQHILTQIYEEAKIQVSDELEDANSIRFFYIRDKILPEENSITINNAVFVLMAFYFESCDIFENPNNKENLENVNA